MNVRNREVIATLGAVTLGICWISATVVALVLSKIATVVTTVPSFVIGMSAALFLALLWKLGKLISGDGTSDNWGAAIFVSASIVLLAAPVAVTFLLKNFTWLQAGLGFLSGSLIVVGYLAYYFGDKFAKRSITNPTN